MRPEPHRLVADIRDGHDQVHRHPDHFEVEMDWHTFLGALVDLDGHVPFVIRDQIEHRWCTAIGQMPEF
jgi:hypothetical protein